MVFASASIVTADLSVGVSVCHTLVLYQNEQNYFTNGEPEDYT